MSSPSAPLTRRRADTLDRLLGAALEELRDSGPDDLTVRRVARRAGVAPATAYTYVTSKEHLVTEVFWARLQALPAPPVDPDLPAPARVAAAMRDISDLLAAEPHLAAACTTAMLASDPAVARLRMRIGAEVAERLTMALGPDATPQAVEALTLAFSGAMLHSGMGHLPRDRLAPALASVAALIFDPPRGRDPT